MSWLAQPRIHPASREPSVTAGFVISNHLMYSPPVTRSGEAHQFWAPWGRKWRKWGGNIQKDDSSQHGSAFLYPSTPLRVNAGGPRGRGGERWCSPFPAPTSGRSQPPVRPVSGAPTSPASTFKRTYPHRDTYKQNNKLFLETSLSYIGLGEEKKNCSNEETLLERGDHL